jgi:transposase, IS4 family
MSTSKYVFSQLTSFLNRSQFNDYVRRYNGDHYVKHFTCWNQLLVMMFGQLSSRESLRDLIVALEAHQSKCYHMGMGTKPVTKTTLARANQDRDYRVFEDFAFYMMNQARKKRIDHIFKLNGNVYAFDSTTIPLCLSVFWWAKFRKRKGGVKVHFLYDLETSVPAFFHVTKASVHDSRVMGEIPYESGSYYVFDRGYNAFAELFKIHKTGSYFIVRAKKNLQYRCVKWRRRLPKNVLTDAEIVLTEEPSFKKYPEKLRLVRYHDDEQDRDFAFLTNAFHLTALEVANLYKNRWQIELFHKWLKQHLKIKRFWGTTENAVRIQISVAIITYCLVAIVQHDMQLERSTYEVLQILSISLTDKTPLKDLFNKTNINDVKEQLDPLIPGLFD